MSDFIRLGATILGTFGVIAAAILSIDAFDESQQRASCVAFSQQTARETRFVNYTYWDRDCLTP